MGNTTNLGYPLLNNIFASNPDTPNHITFLLSRSLLGITNGGLFTIGETAPGFDAITSQPTIAVDPWHDLGQWVGLMEGVVVNGKLFTGHGQL